MSWKFLVSKLEDIAYTWNKNGLRLTFYPNQQK